MSIFRLFTASLISLSCLLPAVAAQETANETPPLTEDQQLEADCKKELGITTVQGTLISTVRNCVNKKRRTLESDRKTAEQEELQGAQAQKKTTRMTAEQTKKAQERRFKTTIKVRGAQTRRSAALKSLQDARRKNARHIRAAERDTGSGSTK